MDTNPAEAKVMRGIVARHRKQALAERGAAPAPAIVVASVGWSTRPGPKRKPSAIDKGIADAAATSKRAWAGRHPEIARDERLLRKARVEMHKRWDHKAHGTAETHEFEARRQEGPLRRLYMSGGIDAEQLASAVAIAEVAELIGADANVRTASLETRIDRSGRGSDVFYEALHQVRREIAYTRWRAEVAVRSKGKIAAVLDMLVGETVGFTVVAERYSMHHRRARRILIEALDLWPQMLGQACREVDEATLIAAQAGILA